MPQHKIEYSNLPQNANSSNLTQNESHIPSAIQYLHHKFPHSAKNGFALVQPTARVFHSP